MREAHVTTAATAPENRLSSIGGAIEIGGTKTLVGVGDASGLLIKPVRILTEEPEPTLDAAARALNGLQSRVGGLGSVGIASFGPLDLDSHSATFGQLVNTPKRAWRSVNLLSELEARIGLPLVLETDVNAAALAEANFAAVGCSDHVYITVGTGVGVGVVVAGRAVHGAGHPEAGHVWVRQRADDAFPGVCARHGSCVEGLVSGPALAARLGAPIESVTPDSCTWDLAGDYLAQLCMSLVLTLAPQRIVLGGGVGSRPEPLRATRIHLLRHLNGYLPRLADATQVETFIVPAVLEHSGLRGALQLALDAAMDPCR